MLTPLGIEICAINVAKWLGAEIYATVGSEDKACFLVKELGIARNRIFNSRDSSFLKGIVDATNGSGVDLALNSLSGELLSTSWKCVAPDGAMVEIGKRDSEKPFPHSMMHGELRPGLESRCLLTQALVRASVPEVFYLCNTNFLFSQWLAEGSLLWHRLKKTELSLDVTRLVSWSRINPGSRVCCSCF